MGSQRVFSPYGCELQACCRLGPCLTVCGTQLPPQTGSGNNSGRKGWRCKVGAVAAACVHGSLTRAYGLREQLCTCIDEQHGATRRRGAHGSATSVRQRRGCVANFTPPASCKHSPTRVLQSIPNTHYLRRVRTIGGHRWQCSAHMARTEQVVALRQGLRGEGIQHIQSFRSRRSLTRVGAVRSGITHTPNTSTT